MKVHINATIPNDLLQKYLQNMRDFDIANPGCHFSAVVDDDGLTIEQARDMLKVEPELPIQQTFIDRDMAAGLVEQMRKEAPWNGNKMASSALFFAARAIRRGRHLTPSEQLLNLATALEDGSEDGARVAAYLRQLAGAGKA